MTGIALGAALVAACAPAASAGAIAARGPGVMMASDGQRDGRTDAGARPVPRLGMSPDEVARLPGWGPPSSRLRTGSGDIVTEVWTYQDARLLVFENGELVYLRDGRR